MYHPVGAGTLYQRHQYQPQQQPQQQQPPYRLGVPGATNAYHNIARDQGSEYGEGEVPYRHPEGFIQAHRQEIDPLEMVRAVQEQQRQREAELYMEAKRLHDEQQQFLAARATHNVPLMSHQFGGVDQRSYSPPPSHGWTGHGAHPHSSPAPAPAPPKSRFAHLVNGSDDAEAEGGADARSVDSHTDLQIHKLSLRRDQVRSLSSTLQSLSKSLA